VDLAHRRRWVSRPSLRTRLGGGGPGGAFPRINLTSCRRLAILCLLRGAWRLQPAVVMLERSFKKKRKTTQRRGSLANTTDGTGDGGRVDTSAHAGPSQTNPRTPNGPPEPLSAFRRPSRSSYPRNPKGSPLAHCLLGFRAKNTGEKPPNCSTVGPTRGSISSKQSGQSASDELEPAIRTHDLLFFRQPRPMSPPLTGRSRSSVSLPVGVTHVAEPANRRPCTNRLLSPAGDPSERTHLDACAWRFPRGPTFFCSSARRADGFVARQGPGPRPYPAHNPLPDSANCFPNRTTPVRFRHFFAPSSPEPPVPDRKGRGLP